MLRETMTENGAVRGLPAADPRITSFKGIPYAAPPVGDLRWRAPRPCADWSGTLDAFTFAPISIQDTPGLGDGLYDREWHVDSEIPMSEDCLYLNIWTNAKSTSERLPVVVWFFGGAFQWGYPSEMEFDGERIARRGVVVVTVNYRLNVFGFLAHKELTKEQPDSPSNFGQLDQQAGLKWVIRNIASFGGDPQNITLAGQSAGGGSVLAQIASPTNEGLFQRAIIESAMIRSPYKDLEIGVPDSLPVAEEKGKDFFEYLGVKTLAEARALDALLIRERYASYAVDHPRMFPIVDTKFTIDDPLKLFGEGKIPDVPIFAGNTSNEFICFLDNSDQEALRKKATELFGDQRDTFLAFPEAKRPGIPIPVVEYSVQRYLLARKRSGATSNSYYYQFDVDIPGDDHPGSFHSVDLWFFFETLAKCSRAYQGRHYDLARHMCNYWCNFIRTGDPNGTDQDGTPMPTWKPFTEETPCNMMFLDEGAIPTDMPISDFKQFIFNYL